MGFDPSAYLAALGWSGPGTGLTATSRTTPITALRKNNTLGIGRERDNSHPWWDHLFASLARKLDHPTQPAPQQQHPQQPPVSSSPTTTSSSALNLDAIHIAKRNAGRIELYRRFHRGTVIPGTDEPPPARRVRFEEPLPTRWGRSTECNGSVHCNNRSDQQHPPDLTHINISVDDHVVALDEPHSKKRKSKASDETRKKKRKQNETTLPIESKPHDSAAHDSIVVCEEPRSKKRKSKKKRDEAHKKKSKNVKAENSTTQDTAQPMELKHHDPAHDKTVALEEPPHSKKRKSKRRRETSEPSTTRKKKSKKLESTSHSTQETADSVQLNSHDSAADDSVALEEPRRKKRKSTKRDAASGSHRKHKSKKTQADEPSSSSSSSSSLAAPPAENDLVKEEKKKKKKKKKKRKEEKKKKKTESQGCEE